MLKLYSVFHLNLAFSSIEEKQWPQVIHHCYWPLLRLIRDHNLPLGIEASGFTLETINQLDSAWIKELKQLCHAGVAEFVGSGYSQLIGPLVPAEVNCWNQQLGLDCYQQLLGLRPQLALVNEQAFSAGLVSHYVDAGYSALIMEWDNPAHGHPHWPADMRYFPQLVNGLSGTRLPLIWNMSLPFQQFQRYAHGELSLEGYLPVLEKHLAEEIRIFSLYGNDAEIFDFRPGRFATESVQVEGEWQRIEVLYQRLQTDSRFKLIKPSEVLAALDLPGAGAVVDLPTSAQPVPVKKQPKYNITRWAVTGRDDLQINSRCHRLCQTLQSQGAGSADWRELCYLWSSDFRTHITSTRWDSYLQRLQQFEQQLGIVNKNKLLESPPSTQKILDPFVVQQDGKLLSIETDALSITLNLRRGLAINRLVLQCDPDRSLIGTVPHGFFDNIELGADYYTGHLVAEIPGDHKITDLLPVEADIHLYGGALVVIGKIKTPLGIIEKRLTFSPNDPSIGLEYHFDWDSFPLATLHLGFMTLPPRSYAENSLFFKTHNGGFDPETFIVGRQPINHLESVTPLVTAGHGLGVTKGLFEIGDYHRSVQILFDPGQAALTAHVLYQSALPDFLYRVVFSAREIDDTCAAGRSIVAKMPAVIQFEISLHKNG